MLNEEVTDIELTESEGAKPETSPASKPVVETQEPSVDGSAKSVEPQVQEPWHKSKQWRKLNEENRSMRDSLEEMRTRQTTLLEQLAQRNNQPSQQGDQLSPEVLADARKLAQILKHPEIAKELGLGGTQEITEQLQRLQSERAEENFTREFESNLSKYAEQYGLDREELEQEVIDEIESNPFFGRQYQPGMAELAITKVLFPRMNELSTRKVNLQLIKDKQLKKSNGTETTTVGDKSKARKFPTKLGDHLDALVKEGGGEIDFDS